MNFFYLFLLVIVNSIWQSALLLLLYLIIIKLVNNIHPLQKRNLLYSFLLLQVLLSALTFICIKYEIGISNILVIPSSRLNNFLLENELILFILYISVLSIKIGMLGFQWSKFYFNYKNYINKPPAALRIFTNTYAMQIGIAKNISLWYSTAVSTPITFGFLKPVILLPFSLCTQLQTKEIEAIILHELTHIKNKDYLLNWILVLMEIIFIFNPFLSIIINNIKLEREKNCDIAVINFKYDSINYAESLLLIARNANYIKHFQIGAVKNISQLYKRIEFFCTPKNFEFKKLHNGIYSVLIIPILLLLFMPALKQKIEVVSYSKSNFINKKPNIKMEYASEAIEPSPLFVEMPINKKIFAKVKPTVAPTLDSNIPYEIPTNSLYKFASVIDTLQNAKEFIYNIESPNGKITRTFELKFAKGKWILIPKLLILQKYNDSLSLLRIDSTYNGLDSLIQ